MHKSVIPRSNPQTPLAGPMSLLIITNGHECMCEHGKWNINGGMRGVGEHMGEWEWLQEGDEFPRKEKNHIKHPLMHQVKQYL